VKVEITSGLLLQAWGACTPNPCDMGSAPLTTYGQSVSDMNHKIATASYDMTFKKVIMTLRISGNSLYVETYNQFTDNSGRQNYWTQDRFVRSRVIPHPDVD
jgi:hypothetical protein